ncbi:MAG TPA: universal stress protein [Verrucomicrobiae bacterium]|nr:universal stress protein [Verrucomicrobiae bacterium]
MKTKPNGGKSKAKTRGIKRGATQKSAPRARKPDPAQTPWIVKIKTILVPVDFSAESEKAIAYAVPFARQFGARIVLLHVVEPVAFPDFEAAFPLVMENDKIMAACKRHLERVARDLRIPPRLVERVLVRHGRSFNEIADAARTLKVDLIIISTHGRTGFKRALVGSTTERVVRHAPCPVLVVRPCEHEFVVSQSKPSN